MKKFEELILKEFPEEMVGPVLVTYKDGDPAGFTIAEGYLRAAERLAKTLDRSGLDASEDMLAFPILFLVRHSLELSLKAYMVKLLNHRTKKCCGNLGVVDTSKISAHELIPLYTSISESIKGDALHSFPSEFAEFKDLIYSLDDEGLSSESLRYTKNTRGDTTLFFSDQKYVAVDSFIETCLYISDRLHCWAENPVFDDCSIGLFRRKANYSYLAAIEIVRKSKDLRDRYQSADKPFQPQTHIMNVHEMAESFKDNVENELKFRNEVEALFKSESPEERAQLAYALELCKGSDSGVAYFLDSGCFFVEQYIQNNIMHLSRFHSVEQLNKRAKKMIKIKSNWKPFQV